MQYSYHNWAFQTLTDKAQKPTYCHMPARQKALIESSNPRRIAVNPNPNLDLEPFKPKPCHL